MSQRAQTDALRILEDYADMFDPLSMMYLSDFDGV
jgi:hypothetical protein